VLLTSRDDRGAHLHRIRVRRLTWNLVLDFLALLVIAAALLFASARIVSALHLARRDETIRHLQTMFAPAIQAVQHDPRQFLVWYPLAQASRRLFPDAFSALDRASGGTFPFSRDQVQEAHAQWTADWLAWERSHDSEYAVKAAALQEELTRGGALTSTVGRARATALEHEKIDRYQERYQQYILTAKALQALVGPSSGAGPGPTANKSSL